MGGKICMRHGGKNWEVFRKNWVVLFDLFDSVDFFSKKFHCAYRNKMLSEDSLIHSVSLFHDTKRPQIPKAHHIGLQR